MDFKSKILSVAKGLHYSSDQFNSTGIHDWPAVMKKIEAKFIIKENSNTKFNWWWEHLKKDNVSIQFPANNTHEYLHHLIDKNEKVWFVSSDTHFDPTKFWLFEGFIEPIQQIIEALPAFEYYLVSKKYEWFLAKNHHNYLAGLGTIKEALQRLSANHNLSA